MFYWTIWLLHNSLLPRQRAYCKLVGADKRCLAALGNTLKDGQKHDSICLCRCEILRWKRHDFLGDLSVGCCLLCSIRGCVPMRRGCTHVYFSVTHKPCPHSGTTFCVLSLPSLIGQYWWLPWRCSSA